MRTIFSSAILAALFGAAGCGGHDHVHAEVPREYEVAQENAADAVLRDTRKYVTDRGTRPGLPPVGATIDVEDAMLESLFEAAEARRLAEGALHLTEDADVDAGRAARVKGSAQAVIDAAALILKDAKAEPLAVAPFLAEDRKVLRATLRALRVDVVAMQREVD